MLRNLLFILIFPFVSSQCYGQIVDNLAKSEDESPIVIDAETSVICDETANKCTATGKAKAQSGTSIVYGDVLTVYFTEGKQRKITVMTANGNVRMETPTETAFGERAHYDAGLDRLILTGDNLKIVTPKETLTARDSIEYWHKENKGIARGNAVAQFHEKNSTAQGDLIVAYFEPSSEKKKDGKEKQKIDRILMTGGDLKLVTPKETLTAKDSIEYYGKENKGIARGNAIAKFKEKDQLVRANTLIAYFDKSSEKTEDGKDKMKIDKVEANGNMLASGPDGVVTGDRGVYFEKTNIVEVFDNVKVNQEGNVIEGGYAKTNLETNVTEMYKTLPSSPEACPIKRISGIIIPKDIKKRKDGQTFIGSARKKNAKPVDSQ